MSSHTPHPAPEMSAATAPGNVMVDLVGVRKSFPGAAGPVEVLGGIDLTIKRGALVTLFAPNGAGKSTLASIVAGLERPDAGHVRVNLRRSGTVPVMFQDYRGSLLPWRTVRENVLFPLRLQGLNDAEAGRRLDALLERFNLRDKVNPRAKVFTLSGGEAQTVCLLRTMIVEPELCIFDEALSALDYGAVLSLRQRVLEMAQALQPTILFISHDLDDALYLGDQVVFLSSRPARVVEVLDVPFAKPRQPALAGSHDFATLKARALDIFLRSSSPDRVQPSAGST